MISIKYKKIFIENDITIKFANMSKDVWTKWSLENLLYTTVIILLYLGGVAPITSPLSPKHHSLHEGKYKTMPDEGTVVTPPWHCTHTYGGGGHLKPGCIILYLMYLYLYIYIWPSSVIIGESCWIFVMDSDIFHTSYIFKRKIICKNAFATNKILNTTEGGHKKGGRVWRGHYKRSMALCGSLVLLSSSQSHFHSHWTEKAKSQSWWITVQLLYPWWDLKQCKIRTAWLAV